MSERLRLTITCDVVINPRKLGVTDTRTAEMVLGEIGAIALHGALENEPGATIIDGVSANATPTIPA